MSWKLGPAGFENTIPTPSAFAITPREIAREGRTASGRLVKDVIAVKRTFTLTYSALTSAEVAILLTEYDRQQFLSFIYPDRGADRTATVWFAEFPRERLLHQSEYWGNFDIVLEEQ